jgi:hypothetical protein
MSGSINNSPEPEAASAPPAPAPPRRRRGPHGHGEKIDEADRELSALGQLPSTLRPAERNRRLQNHMAAKSCYGTDIPTRSSIQRYYDLRRRRGL